MIFQKVILLDAVALTVTWVLSCFKHGILSLCYAEQNWAKCEHNNCPHLWDTDSSHLWPQRWHLVET